MSAKMTPGPWKHNGLTQRVGLPEDYLARAVWTADGKTPVCNTAFSVGKYNAPDQEICHANAVAIAALPDLIAALEGIFAQTAKHSRQWGQEAGAHAFARDPDTAKAFAAGREALKKAGAL